MTGRILALVFCASCVSATLVEDDPPACAQPTVLSDDVMIVVTNANIEGLSIFIRGRYDAEREGFVLIPLCYGDRQTELGERGFARPSYRSDGTIEMIFEPIAALDALFGESAAGLAGDIIVPARALPPEFDQSPVVVRVQVVVEQCASDMICGKGSLETVWPTAIDITLEGEILITPESGGTEDLRWGCAANPFTQPAASCARCSEWECFNNLGLDDECRDCLGAICEAAENCCNLWTQSCLTAANASCDCI